MFDMPRRQGERERNGFLVWARKEREVGVRPRGCQQNGLEIKTSRGPRGVGDHLPRLAVGVNELDQLGERRERAAVAQHDRVEGVGVLGHRCRRLRHSVGCARPRRQRTSAEALS